MTLRALLEATSGVRPGYAECAHDALLDVAEPETAEQWIGVAQVFATLALAEAVTELSRWYQETNP